MSVIIGPELDPRGFGFINEVISRNPTQKSPVEVADAYPIIFSQGLRGVFEVG